MNGIGKPATRAAGAPIPSYRRQAIALVLLCAALGVGAAWWHAHERQRDVDAQRVKLAQFSVTGTARAIEKQLEVLRKQITLLALGNQQLLERVIRNRDDFTAADELRSKVKLEFPESVAVTLTDMEGNPFMEDFDGFIVEACRVDIGHFVAEHHPPNVVIHPNPIAYHFDIMVEIPLPSGPKVFFVSFSPHVIRALLENGQLYGHRLILLHQDRPGLIEVSVDGARDAFAEAEYFLSSDEHQRIIWGAPIAGTLWTLVDIPAASLVSDERGRAWTQFAVELALMLVLAGVLIVLLVRSERHITAQHKALLRQMHELTRSEARLRRTQDIAQLGYWDYNLATDAMNLSDGVRHMLGIPVGEPVTVERLFGCVVEGDRTRLRFAIGRAIIGRRECHAEIHARCADDGVRTVHLTMELGNDPDGNPLTLFGIAQDVTHWRHAEQAAREARKAQQMAESASLAKSSFLANMSHEIRTPLTAIIGFGEALLDERQTPEDRQDAVRTIIRNGRHLLEIVNDILDLSKIEAGKLVVEQVPCAPLELLGEVEAIARLKAQERGLNFEVKCVAPLPRRIITDPLRFKQALLNLCANAVKFTKAGRVTIEMRCDRAAQRLSVAVTDTGVGMTPNQLRRIFSPFTQADTSTSRRFGGTGLGLSISRQLAELLGGDVTASSEYGVGSRFVLSVATGLLDDDVMLPASGTEAAPEVAPSVPGFALLSGRVLLVEDTVDNQRLISLLLRRMGLDVAVASDGASGVRLATEQNFDVILMDMQMPGMDGIEATALLRTQEYRGVIIALTANAMKEDREHCIAAGCDDFMAKPVDRLRLNQTLARYLKPRSLPREHTPLRSSLVTGESRGRVFEFADGIGAELAAMRDAAQRRSYASLNSRATALAKAALQAGFPEIADRAAQLELQSGAANDAEIAALLADLDWLHTRLRATCESGALVQGQRGAM